MEERQAKHAKSKCILNENMPHIIFKCYMSEDVVKKVISMFHMYGTVVDLKIIENYSERCKDSRFGYVVYSKMEEFERAYQNMNHRKINGVRIFLQFIRPNKTESSTVKEEAASSKQSNNSLATNNSNIRNCSMNCKFESNGLKTEASSSGLSNNSNLERNIELSRLNVEALSFGESNKSLVSNNCNVKDSNIDSTFEPKRPKLAEASNSEQSNNSLAWNNPNIKDPNFERKIKSSKLNAEASNFMPSNNYLARNISNVRDSNINMNIESNRFRTEPSHFAQSNNHLARNNPDTRNLSINSKTESTGINVGASSSTQSNNSIIRNYPALNSQIEQRRFKSEALHSEQPNNSNVIRPTVELSRLNVEALFRQSYASTVKNNCSTRDPNRDNKIEPNRTIDASNCGPSNKSSNPNKTNIHIDNTFEPKRKKIEASSSAQSNSTSGWNNPNMRVLNNDSKIESSRFNVGASSSTQSNTTLPTNNPNVSGPSISSKIESSKVTGNASYPGRANVSRPSDKPNATAMGLNIKQHDSDKSVIIIYNLPPAIVDTKILETICGKFGKIWKCKIVDRNEYANTGVVDFAYNHQAKCCAGFLHNRLIGNRKLSVVLCTTQLIEDLYQQNFQPSGINDCAECTAEKLLRMSNAEIWQYLKKSGFDIYEVNTSAIVSFILAPNNRINPNYYGYMYDPSWLPPFTDKPYREITELPLILTEETDTRDHEYDFIPASMLNSTEKYKYDHEVDLGEMHVFEEDVIISNYSLENRSNAERAAEDLDLSSSLSEILTVDDLESVKHNREERDQLFGSRLIPLMEGILSEPDLAEQICDSILKYDDRNLIQLLLAMNPIPVIVRAIEESIMLNNLKSNAELAGGIRFYNSKLYPRIFGTIRCKSMTSFIVDKILDMKCNDIYVLLKDFDALQKFAISTEIHSLTTYGNVAYMA